ncbi:four helix bundle protein [Hymenobacter pini]|uniref:four helix bundle protein n=1 Tax=Hymenobacter pini TaxID=2880879 RepID=UPI0021D42346|nr:four helix bundle protein [Hymenobacter pini]
MGWCRKCAVPPCRCLPIIAEGAGRNSKPEFRQFLAIANGSAYELETQFLLAASFGYVSEENLNTISSQLTELQKMLFGLQKSLI